MPWKPGQCRHMPSGLQLLRPKPSIRIPSTSARSWQAGAGKGEMQLLRPSMQAACGCVGAQVVHHPVATWPHTRRPLGSFQQQPWCLVLGLRPLTASACNKADPQHVVPPCASGYPMHHAHNGPMYVTMAQSCIRGPIYIHCTTEPLEVALAAHPPLPMKQCAAWCAHQVVSSRVLAANTAPACQPRA
jgi:hypothetical protein